MDNENKEKKVCEDKKCIGYRKRLVDRGYGYLVCPSTIRLNKDTEYKKYD